MRAAPAVRVTVRAGTLSRGVPASLAGLAAGAVGAWALGHAGLPSGFGLLAVPVAAGLAWRLAGHAPVELAWDGQHWQCDGIAGAAVVRIDLQQALLVRWHASDDPSRHRWLVPTALSAGPAWHALRVALFAGQSATATDPAVLP